MIVAPVLYVRKVKHKNLGDLLRVTLLLSDERSHLETNVSTGLPGDFQNDYVADGANLNGEGEEYVCVGQNQEDRV